MLVMLEMFSLLTQDAEAEVAEATYGDVQSRPQIIISGAAVHKEQRVLDSPLHRKPSLCLPASLQCELLYAGNGPLNFTVNTNPAARLLTITHLPTSRLQWV